MGKILENLHRALLLGLVLLVVVVVVLHRDNISAGPQWAS